MAQITHEVSGDAENGYIVDIHDGDRSMTHTSTAHSEQEAVAEAIAQFHSERPVVDDHVARVEQKVVELAATVQGFVQGHADMTAALDELKRGFEDFKVHAATVSGLGGAIDALGHRISAVEDAMKPKAAAAPRA